MSPSDKHSEAIDLSHHLSRISRARTTSPLKGLQRYYGQPGIISLAGGLPHPEYFPFSSISADALVAESLPPAPGQETSAFSWLRKFFQSSKERTTRLSIPKYPVKPGDISLSTALQYSLATGLPQLQEIIKEISGKVYQPAYSNYTTLIHAGNTDGWAKAAMTLCNPGDGVLTCEWTYPSALAAMLPLGARTVPVSMDGQGMRSDHLRALLSEWNEGERGMPRPHVMYTIPVGQNPTGSRMEAKRKKEIYDICVEFDIIIVEDDPYYFIQQGPYVPEAERSRSLKSHPCPDEEDEYIRHLAPSYLKFDYQGRVIRLDSFSKTIAPGCRMGWFTCNPMFAERLERQGETTTQAPCGFSQSIVASLLLRWGFKGYIQWLKALNVQYTQRRDFFLDCVNDEFHLVLAPATTDIWEGCNVYQAFQKLTHTPAGFLREKSQKPLFSFVPPTSGMFVWFRINFEDHLSFDTLGWKALEMKLWIAFAEAGILIGPGAMFDANTDAEDNVGAGHFRISFSNAEFKDMKKAIRIFASILQDFFDEL